VTKRLSLLFSVLFLDFITFSAVIAFLPLFFLETPHSFFRPDFPANIRYILLGFFTAIYPLAQVIAAPLLGHFSDRIGRKGILLTSYIGNTAGYFLCSLGILNQSVIPLFIGYFVAGLTGVNLSTTNAVISDVSLKEKRSKFFAISHLVLGLGFILGPYVAGQIVSQSQLVFQTCFYLFVVCGAVSILNLFLISLFWSNVPTKRPEFNLKDFLKCDKRLKTFFWAEFLIFFGWYFFIKTFQVFLVEKIGCTEIQVLNYYSQYGLWFSVSQGLFILWLHKYSRSDTFFKIFTFLLASSIFALTFIEGYFMTCFVIPLFTLGYAALIPSLTARASEYALLNENGKVMGLHQSVQAIAKIISPVAAGALLSVTPIATVLLAPLFILASRAFLKSESPETEKAL